MENQNAPFTSSNSNHSASTGTTAEGNTSGQQIKHNIDAHNHVAKWYDQKHAEIYNPVEQERLTQLLQKMVTALPMPANQVHACDVGAGTGNITLKLLALGCHVTAADVSETSLNLLRQKTPLNDLPRLQTVVIQGERLPFAPNSFQLVTTYSVLHHIPNYLNAVKNLLDICAPQGFVLIDHEHAAQHWQPDPTLQAWQQIVRMTRYEHLRGLITRGELFTLPFVKTIFQKLFVNPRYEREGDLHVWPDDHIEWPKILELASQNNFRIVESPQYLLYHPKATIQQYEYYQPLCANMQYAWLENLTEGN